MNKQVLGLFFSILLLATILRVYGLTQVPNSVSADEASFAYNAYSILKEYTKGAVSDLIINFI